MKRLFAIGGWGVAFLLAWTLWQRGADQGGTFLEKRVAVLEADNIRLSRHVTEMEDERRKAADLPLRTKVEKDTAAIRELAFLEPVQYDVVTKDGLRAVLEQKLSAQATDEDFQNMAHAYSALGLLPADYPLKERYVDLIREQLGAFYDQHERKLYMFNDAHLDNSQNRVILAHELTHALQDQHFKLRTFPLEILDNDDLVMATSALIEGDATVVMTQFMLGEMSGNAVKDAVRTALTQNMEQLGKAPRFLRETLIFPYLRGQDFCLALFERGGFEAITKAYAEPPRSTAQILHPELYLAEPRVNPIRLSFGDPRIGDEAPIMENVLGEFSTRILLSEHGDALLAEKAATGWRGDRYAVYRDGKAWMGVWLWASEADATEFADAMDAALKKRHEKAGRHFFVKVLDQKRVVVADANDPDFLAKLLAKGTDAVSMP